MKYYYAILGVPREAEADLIKATYLALSKGYISWINIKELW